MFNLKSAAFCLEIWSCVGDGEIGGLQAIRQRKALTFISDVPSPTAAWNNKMSVVEQLVGTVWMHIFHGPPKSTVTYTWQNSSSRCAQTLDNFRHYWSPNVHPSLDLSAGVHTWCWTRDVQEPGKWEVNTFDSKMSQFVISIIFLPEFSSLHWWPGNPWTGRCWISTPVCNNSWFVN